jgi:hypothetical protein
MAQAGTLQDPAVIKKGVALGPIQRGARGGVIAVVAGGSTPRSRRVDTGGVLEEIAVIKKGVAGGMRFERSTGR